MLLSSVKSKSTDFASVVVSVAFVVVFELEFSFLSLFFEQAYKTQSQTLKLI